jgi:RNA polymerase sigma-70 factor, ECF subfamily
MGSTRSVRTPESQLDRLGYERYGPPLYGYILRIVGSAADAKDILQDTFIRALSFLEREGAADEQHYRRWLYAVATNLCRDDLRRRARNLHRAIPLDVAEQSPGGQPLAEKQLVDLADPATSFPSRLARQQLIEQVFARMEPQELSALLLSDHFGFSLQEVAQVLDCSYAAAAKRVGRARERFARHYRELGGEEVRR